MDFNTTIDLIIRELDEACDILDDLKQIPGTQLLQVELARSKCKNAASVIALLKDLQEKTKQNKDTKQVTGNKVKEETLVVTTIKPPVFQGVDEKKSLKEDIIDKSPGNIIIQKEAEPEHSKDHDQSTERKPFVAPIIADTFSHLSRFNEQMGETQDYKHGRLISDLSEAIGLNDRFYYIREIFNDDRDKYNKAIKEVEGTKSIEEAKEIILRYNTEKTDPDALKHFLDLVKRKFSK